MAQLIDEVAAAWRALSGESLDVGWKSIRISTRSPSLLFMAARYFPGNLEALLVGFENATLLPSHKLPACSGFSVTCVENQNSEKPRLWLALCRQQTANSELFATLVADVITAVQGETSGKGVKQLSAFFDRLFAWQEFMRKGATPLSSEAEVGLVGELCFLETLLSEGIDSLNATLAWVGPLDAPQDFVLGTGAIEIKSTIAQVGFLAKFGSLEQLDDTVLSPLYVAGQRLALSELGLSLPEWIEKLKLKFDGDQFGIELFSQRVLAAGYLPAHLDHYRRRFMKKEMTLAKVDANFPRLVPGTVPQGIRKASYEVDLTHTEQSDLTMTDVLKNLGVS
ncbi:Conserved hypothetical protein [Herminiimonas arsenicoxydans]|uniref:PD-(D/E)XK motif protein n=1 Tax=Herminiimonas arsenicoxydans TaxID=204773 RepID=A4G661_HERAR|nr:Conserved hypothetical protein [Herminiimonas arsenicoxydans]